MDVKLAMTLFPALKSRRPKGGYRISAEIRAIRSVSKTISRRG